MPSDSLLTAKIEPFDTFWEAPENIEKGYKTFGKFYQRNYLRYFPKDQHARILATSCGPGYFINLLKKKGYDNLLGIDSDPEKIEYAKLRGLNCKTGNAFDYLKKNQNHFDVIFVEQEINHLTKAEILKFLELCRDNLSDNGTLIVHSLNGANPITGSEALAQNFDHYNTFTEYSLKQILQHANFKQIKVFPLVLFVFYKNPLNYIGLLLDFTLNLFFRLCFIFYGKKNQIFSKKIAAVCKKL
jgi:2-polyprenyl-3-methyl-5-hydroxy-6-metoxy-1,4-benzoquinol methylase